MSLIKKEYRIEGVAPLLLHNGNLADPLSEIAIEMKKASGKRNKTQEDHEALAHLEFMGGLYLDEELHPCIPGEMIESCIIAGSKKTKNGQKFKSTLLCDGNFPIEYDGPKTAEALFADKKFVDRRGVVVSQSRIFRTRPRFNQWALKFTLTWDSELIDVATVDKAVEMLAVSVGWVITGHGLAGS